MSLEQKITNLLNQDEKDLKSTLCLLLIAVTTAVYLQVMFHQFLNYDDHLFVYENPRVYTGLTWANVKWAFTTLHGDASYWHPLTWLSLQLDCQLFGTRPGALHLTNLLFHLANTTLLFIVLDKLTGKMWRSLMVAALFALHPLHIETVAWVAERKGLVCTFFWLLTTWAYIGYARRPGILRYVLVFVLCAASLMSKPFAVTLPFTLLFVDFWPLQRLRFPEADPPLNESSPSPKREQLRFGYLLSAVGEKVPLFVCAMVVAYLTVLAQANLGALSSLQGTPLGVRGQNAIIAYCLYLGKMFWPFNLAPIYPLRSDWTWWQTAGCGFLLLCLSLWAVQLARKQRFFLFGRLWYVGTLLPVIGLIQAGSQGMADRYTYVPLIGIFIGMVWGLSDALESLVKWKTRLVFGSALLIFLCAVSSSLQLSYWKNSVRLFEHATRSTSRNNLAYCNLGLAFHTFGNLTENEENLRKSLGIRASLSKIHLSLGGALFEKGDVSRALKEYNVAIKLKPEDEENYAALANLYENSEIPKFHKPAKAVEFSRRACELTQYRRRDLLVFLAGTFAKNDQLREAKKTAEDALKMSITSKEVHEVGDLLENIQGAERQKSAGKAGNPDEP